MFDCRYCGRYTRLRPCCSSVECTAKNDEYLRQPTPAAREGVIQRKWGWSWTSPRREELIRADEFTSAR